MHRAELSESQLEKIRVVMSKLGGAGWNLDEWLESFESITAVHPEVGAFYESITASLCLTYSFKSEHISILIGTKDHDEYVEYRVYHGDKFEEVLDLIIEHQDVVSFSNNRGLLRALKDLCGQLYREEQGFEGEPVTDEELGNS